MSTQSSIIVQRVWNYCNPYGCGMTVCQYFTPRELILGHRGSHAAGTSGFLLLPCDTITERYKLFDRD